MVGCGVRQGLGKAETIARVKERTPACETMRRTSRLFPVDVLVGAPVICRLNLETLDHGSSQAGFLTSVAPLKTEPLPMSNLNFHTVSPPDQLIPTSLNLLTERFSAWTCLPFKSSFSTVSTSQRHLRGNASAELHRAAPQPAP